MENIVEISYPLTFREEDAKALGEHLEFRHSVELVGMKRVGINTFLRFFLFHKNIKKKYMPEDGKNLFIFVDLNDLIERELFSFWRLTLKRIVDAVEQSSASSGVKQKISTIFLNCIQSGDFFLTYDGVKEALVYLSNQDMLPTIFFTRFDRLKDAVSLEFFDNLQSLKYATQNKLAYIFTSFRELSDIAPNVFDKKSLAVFSNVLYIKPANQKDMKVMMQAFAKEYTLTLPEELTTQLLHLSGGHAQYLQLFLIILQELSAKGKSPSTKSFLEAIKEDERIMLLSEELWESLTSEEQEVIQKVFAKKNISEEEKQKTNYVWESGFVNSKEELFSPLFAQYVEGKEITQDNGGLEFSKKEHMLFSLLEKNINEICERETIVELVWPEYKEYGVSDWSIDRLVARVRGKLKKQKTQYEIVTVRTRGYKLVTA